MVILNYEIYNKGAIVYSRHKNTIVIGNKTNIEKIQLICIQKNLFIELRKMSKKYKKVIFQYANLIDYDKLVRIINAIILKNDIPLCHKKQLDEYLYERGTDYIKQIYLRKKSF